MTKQNKRDFVFWKTWQKRQYVQKLSRIVWSGLELDRVIFCFRYESTRATIEVASFWPKHFLTYFSRNVSDWFWPKHFWLILAKPILTDFGQTDSDWFWPKRFWLILTKTFLTGGAAPQLRSYPASNHCSMVRVIPNPRNNSSGLGRSYQTTFFPIISFFFSKKNRKKKNRKYFQALEI